MRVGINIVFGVPGENDNGRRVELCMGNTYFEHKCLHKYTKVAIGQDGVEVIMNMIDLVLEKKAMLQ